MSVNSCVTKAMARNETAKQREWFAPGRWKSSFFFLSKVTKLIVILDRKCATNNVLVIEPLNTQLSLYEKEQH